MSLSSTLVEAVRLSVSDPSLDVRIADRTSRWVSDVANVSIRVLGIRRLGIDEPRIRDVGDPSGDLREMIHGVRVVRLQIVVDGDTHDLGFASEDLADRIVAGFERSDVRALLEAENLSVATCGPVLTAPARGDAGDTRSVAIFDLAFNTSREVRGDLVSWIETAPVSPTWLRTRVLGPSAGALTMIATPPGLGALLSPSGGLLDFAGGMPGIEPPLYYTHGWTDSDYYQGPDGGGRAVIGTVRLVAFLIGLPGASQRLVAARMSASQRGWRIQTGLANNAISLIVGGSVTGWGETSRYTFSAGDVGKLFVLHGTAGSGTLRLSMGGAEVGTGSSSYVATEPAASDRVTFGRWQHAGGLSNPYVGIVSLSASPNAMTPAQIAADAAAIMASGTTLALPTMPGEDMRFVASDIAAGSGGPWGDRDGNDCTLTENGSVLVTQVPP